MKTKIFPIIITLCCILASMSCFVSSLYAGSMDVTVVEPDPGRNELYVKLQGDAVVAVSAQLGASGHKVVADMLKIKMHCDSDFDIDWYRFDEEHHEKHNNTRTLYHQEPYYQITSISDLATQCSDRVQGNGTFTTNIDVPRVILKCIKFAIVGPDTKKRKVYDNLTIPLKVKCTPAPDTVEATVSQKWTYSCPDTPKTDQAFWERYRFVVKGTYSTSVVSKMPQGNVKCVRAFQSDDWLEKEGIFQPVAD